MSFFITYSAPSLSVDDMIQDSETIYCFFPYMHTYDKA